MVDIAWVPVGDELGPTVFVVLGNHRCLPPVDLALPENPRRESVCCSQVVRFVSCSLDVVDPRFARFLDCLLGFVEAGVAVCVVAAFFVLVEVLVVAPSRVVPLFAVGVVGFDVGGGIDARGLRSCATFT